MQRELSQATSGKNSIVVESGLTKSTRLRCSKWRISRARSRKSQRITERLMLPVLHCCSALRQRQYNPPDYPFSPSLSFLYYFEIKITRQLSKPTSSETVLINRPPPSHENSDYALQLQQHNSKCSTNLQPATTGHHSRIDPLVVRQSGRQVTLVQVKVSSHITISHTSHTCWTA